MYSWYTFATVACKKNISHLGNNVPFFSSPNNHTMVSIKSYLYPKVVTITLPLWILCHICYQAGSISTSGGCQNHPLVSLILQHFSLSMFAWYITVNLLFGKISYYINYSIIFILLFSILLFLEFFNWYSGKTEECCCSWHNIHLSKTEEFSSQNIVL